MSKINRIRIMNLNYNGNTMRIDDETFDLNGESTLLSLRNGGGKTVLVQMIMSLFVHKKYRDFSDRPFKSYFTTNQPTFIMAEWLLDHGQGYFLTGMMVRKNQNPEEEEDLEMINFTAFYQKAAEYDMDHLPIVENRGNVKVLRGFGDCRAEFEKLKKEKNSEFSYYDMGNANHRRMYFTKLGEYQINYKEWESIIKKVNLKESGLSELFSNAKDEKGLVEKWFLDAIENKLNVENSRIKGFQSLAYKFIRMYRNNQSKIQQKNIMEKYFEDAKVMDEAILEYEQSEEALEQQKSQIADFTQKVNKKISSLNESLAGESEEKQQLEISLKRIEQERISYEYYKLQEEKAEKVEDRLLSETRIIASKQKKDEAEKKLCRLQCVHLYEEAQDFRENIAQLQQKINIIMEQQKDTEGDRIRLGSILYHYYSEKLQECHRDLVTKQEEIANTVKKQQENQIQSKQEMDTQKSLSTQSGALEQAILSYSQVEETFNRRFSFALSRNILGEYEEGSLQLYEKKMEEQVRENRQQIEKCSKRVMELEKEKIRIENSKEEYEKRNVQLSYELSKLQENEKKMKEEKEERLILMQYIDAPEEELDSKTLLLHRFEEKIEELEKVKENYVTEEKTYTKEYDNLRQGKVIELPENVMKFLAESGIDIIYGMEWLQKNGRSVQENQSLVRDNPFLPYSIIISRNDMEKLSKNNKEIYTNFPIPVMMREELEEKVMQSPGSLITLEKISFFVMFNSHLLDRKALEQLLEEKKAQIEEVQKKIQTKKEEIEEYRFRRSILERQEFTLAGMEKTSQEIEKLKEEENDIQSQLVLCKEKKKELTDSIEDIRKAIEQCKSLQKDYDIRKEEYISLVSAYEKYEENRRKQDTLKKKKKESEERLSNLHEEYKKLVDSLETLKLEKGVLEDKKNGWAKEVSEFSLYEKEEKQKVSADFDYAGAKIRYQAITQGLSADIKELREHLNREEKRYQEKLGDLNHKNKYNFPVEEYETLLYSKEEETRLEREVKDLEREVNASTEANITVANQIASLDEKIQFCQRELQEKTGLEEPLDKKSITEIDFPVRKKLAIHELEQVNKRIREFSEQLNSFENTQAAMSEYTDFKVSCEVLEYSLDSMTKEELLRFQGQLRRDFQNRKDSREKTKQKTERQVQDIAVREDYKEEFFQKGFNNLLSLIENAENMKKQLETTLASYTSILQKLQVDLENVEKERNSLEETFLEYIKDVNEHMERIDKNSSVTIRERSIKMLKITVPSWEDNKELYQVRVRDFASSFIQMGMETIDQNQNIEEFLGKVITTKRLYDEVVGMGNVGVRLYKIEAEREVPISWAEVSANSGGEGFLSAFVILSSLLSYMRRDETDLFAMGEEGKVLLMDNPFAQTNAEHLLKPLTDMAKKTNTQLICLSGIGGDSVYNRFENIYVLKLVSSSLKKGMQYLKSSHTKGNDIQKMQLSQFHVEQASLFDFMEE